MIIRGISNIFSSDNDNRPEMKQVWDYYPNLFDEDRKHYERQQEQNELEEYKIRRKKFAERFNRKRRGDID